MTHTFTSKIIKQWSKNPDSVTVDQKSSINKLNGLKIKYIKHLIRNGKKEDIQAFRDSYNKWKEDKNEDVDWTDEQLSEFYGAIKLEEFIAMAQTDLDFQKILNDIVDSDGKSFLSKLLDELMNIMSSLLKQVGLNLKSNSLLYNTLLEVNNLINLDQQAQLEIENKSVSPQLVNDVDKLSDFVTEDLLPSIEDIQELKRICK